MAGILFIRNNQYPTQTRITYLNQTNCKFSFKLNVDFPFSHFRSGRIYLSDFLWTIFLGSIPDGERLFDLLRRIIRQAPSDAHPLCHGIITRMALGGKWNNTRYLAAGLSGSISISR